MSDKLSEDCANDFSKFGGLRIVKRWLKLAEESDRIAEMTVLVKLCNKLPFNELAVKEVGIGKIIRKLLKFQSPSGGDVTSLHTEIDKLMSNWRAKQMEIASKQGANGTDAKMEKASDKPPSGLVLAISDRLTQQRGQPVDPSEENHRTGQRQQIDNNENKDDVAVKNEYLPPKHSLQNSLPLPRSNSSPKAATSQELGRSTDSVDAGANGAVEAMRKLAPRPAPVLPMLQRNGAAAQDSARLDATDAMDISGPASAAPTPLAVKPPVAVRERKPLDMAEGARKLLAMRAQQALAAPAQQTDGNGSPVRSFDSSAGPPLSPSTSNVLSILSAVGKARIASGVPTPVQVHNSNFFFMYFVYEIVYCAAHAAARY